MFNVTEVNTKESLKVRFRRACRGQRTWHVWREVSGTWETLPVPAKSGKSYQSKKRKAEDHQGVGLTHSTPRTGKPTTRGKG